MFDMIGTIVLLAFSAVNYFGFIMREDRVYSVSFLFVATACLIAALKF